MILLPMIVRDMGINRVFIVYMPKMMRYMKFLICVVAMVAISSMCNVLMSQELDSRADFNQSFDSKEALTLKIFPNPATEFVTIKANKKLEAQFKLSNIVGKIILEGQIDENGQTIDLLDYRTGIYIISIYDTKGKKLATRKIIKN